MHGITAVYLLKPDVTHFLKRVNTYPPHREAAGSTVVRCHSEKGVKKSYVKQ